MTHSIEILHLDESVIVGHKPSGMLSVPGKTVTESFTSHLADTYGEAHVVHRLDCETSGVMIVARTKSAQRHLNQQFQQRNIDKHYVALGHGTCLTQQGLIELPLIADWPNRPKQKIDFVEGRPSQTRWRLLEANKDFSRFSLIPITGRSHQLRMHLKALGHPILGDKLYSPRHPPIESLLYPAMCLHAEWVAFTHPVTEARIRVESPVPF